MTLEIKNEVSVTLEGYFDGNRELQFRYRTEELAQYGDSITIYSDDDVRVTLESPAGTTLQATHVDGRETVTWQAVANGVVHTFTGALTEPAEVTAEAEPRPPKNIFVDLKPTGGLPDT